MTQPDRKKLMEREIAQAAGLYIVRESNKQSLITVLHTDMSSDFSHAIIYVSVFPEEIEKPALDFLKRSRGDFRKWIAKKINFKRVPTFDFAIDVGEKNRQVVQPM